MGNPEIQLGSERGYRLYKASEAAVRMVAERINLENLGLNLKKLPLCSEEECVQIEEIIPRAKDGFVLAFKSSSSRKDQDVDLLSLTTPFYLKTEISEIKITERQNTLPEYWHVLATLETLSQSGRVSFYQFQDPPENIDYETGMRETFWLNTTDSFERVWEVLEELESLVRVSLYESKPMATKDILKIGHFFMTSKKISQVFDCF